MRADADPGLRTPAQQMLAAKEDATSNLSVARFRQEFEYLIEAELPPLVLDVPSQNAQRT